MRKFPCTNKTEDIALLFSKMPTVSVPEGKIDAGYFKSWGFSTVSIGHLFDILKLLNFIDEKDQPTDIWSNFVVSEKRAQVLASAIKSVYADLFVDSLCPYLESDDNILDFFKRYGKSTNKELIMKLETFRSLNDLADFQEILNQDESNEEPGANAAVQEMNVKVNPNLQLNIQIHIDPNTPEEKIEAIFKNMRKYLLEKQAI